jgi:hypothetical protein
VSLASMRDLSYQSINAITKFTHKELISIFGGTLFKWKKKTMETIIIIMKWWKSILTSHAAIMTIWKISSRCECWVVLFLWFWMLSCGGKIFIFLCNGTAVVHFCVWCVYNSLKVFPSHAGSEWQKTSSYQLHQLIFFFSVLWG